MVHKTYSANRTGPSLMNKSNIMIGLGSLSMFIGSWFWASQRDSLSNNEFCINSVLTCPAETLQWVGIAQVLAGLAIVYIGLILIFNPLPAFIIV